jgi:putative CocE/NonD family hydrolase
MGDTPFVMVLQNVRGAYDSEGKNTYDPMDFRVDMNDGYDTIEWIAKQKWSNGKVGMWGPSGHGIAPINAMWSLAPHLTAIDVNVTGGNSYLYWIMSNGARRFEYSWLAQRGLKTGNNEWPRPTVAPYNPQQHYAFLKEIAPKVKAYYRDDGGWFDIFSESCLDNFAALAPYGKAHVKIGPGGHGKIFGDLDFKPRNQMSAEAMKLSEAMGLKARLTDAPLAEPKSLLVYFLMGDGKDSSAPGNVWMTSNKWPVDHTPTSYYLRADSTLAAEPAKDKGSLSYDYDPKNPVPMLGGHHQVSDAKKPNIGPMDQRPNAGRKDILRFKTEPLTEPVGITGKVWLDLYVSSDAPDTMFTAKLVDIYPDGYEAILREGAILARYHKGFDKPSPLEPGKVYKLSLDLWSTANVFAKGHRIAVYVTSSSDPAYEVHPNTYEQVQSIEAARVAHNTVHMSAEHPSRLILPVIAKETYINLGAKQAK